MENQQNVARARVLLDALGDRIQRLSVPLRTLADKTERDIVPAYEILEALREDLSGLVCARKELDALGIKMGGLFLEELPRIHYLEALDDYEEQAGRRELLWALSRMHSDDVACMSAITAVQGQYRDCEAQVEEKYAALNLLIEAFRTEKPMEPRRMIAYNTKLAKAFPEILISAVLINDPPIDLTEEGEEETRTGKIPPSVLETEAESPTEMQEEHTDTEETVCVEGNQKKSDAVTKKKANCAARAKAAEEERLETTVFDRVRALCAERHPLVQCEDHTAEVSINAKGIKRYLTNCKSRIAGVRCGALHMGLDSTFTARALAQLSDVDLQLAETVLADGVQRGFLCSMQFEGLPKIYREADILKKTCAESKELARILHIRDKSKIDMEQPHEIAPHEAVAVALQEKAFLHGARRRTLTPVINGDVQNACGILSCESPHMNELMAFLLDAPDRKWIKMLCKRRTELSPHTELLAYDESHLEEMRGFLTEQLEEPFAVDEYYLLSDDEWILCAEEEAPASDENEAEESVQTSEIHESVAEESLAEVASVPVKAVSAMEMDEPLISVEVEAAEQPQLESAAPKVLPTEEEQISVQDVAEIPPVQAETIPVQEPVKPQSASTEIIHVPMDAAKITAELHAMLAAEDFASASAYLHAAAHFDPTWTWMNRALAYALCAPLQKCRYSSNTLMNIYFTEAEETYEGLAVAAILWNFYLDHTPYDHAMKSLLDTASGFSLLKDVTVLSDTLYALMRFKQKNDSGVDKYADYRLKDKSRLAAKKKEIEARAKAFEDQYINGHIKEKGSNRRFIETQKLIFDHDGDLAQSLRSVVEGDKEAFELIKEYVSQTFLESVGGDRAGAQDISAAKIEELIDAFWYEAGNLVSLKKQSSKLVGNFRTTLQKRLEKIAALLVEWMDCIDALGIRDTDDALAAYQKLRPDLLDQLNQSVENLDAAALPVWETNVLRRALREIARRIGGDYDEKEYHYFYADFLRTPWVLLDGDFLPRVTRGVAELAAFFPLCRIEQHFRADKPSFEERLHTIVDGYDDLGSARQIVRMLTDTGVEANAALCSAVERMDENLIKMSAEHHRKDFIESLELAQSYGQIESSTEDKKEKILQSINVVFDCCLPAFDFGFFAAVVEAFREKIAREAMQRGDILSKELAELRADASVLMDAEKKEQRAQKFTRIDEMIAAKNYTAAEDMLRRFGTDDEDSPLEALQTDDLRDFLRSYENSYGKVFDASRGLRALLRVRGTTKSSRGGERLVDAWLPRGGPMDVQKIRALLHQLGFAVSEVRATRNAKTEQYEVLLAEAAGGRRSFSHPFADFGSRGARAPFRVVCLYGRFDADALIAKFKEIGTAKHTIVLLDYALSEDQRRRFARKTKSDIPECAFALVDRVVAAYIAEHYEETKLPQMLFSITMPYTFYQPYIPNAVNSMPPEMFIGRKAALEKIIDPLGENIIYGGRQLGKSALLRMAEHSVNRLGDGSCALMVDIKSCDVEEAALRISRAFADRKILAADFETRDWGTLARAVEVRLKDEEAWIPYLLLLIDEADAFIESCKAVAYRPFEELKRIQSEGEGRFKFVIAGLRNVVRFDKEALSNNSVLAHLKSYTVRPFSVMEARELLEVPLSFLGLRFPAEKQALVSTILATTNYFPGLIQLYCYKLLEAMKKNYAGYNEVDSPPYDISENHIKKVLNEDAFLRDIYEKFDITLRVDEDCYYHIIAILMAWLYHDRNDQRGYLPEDLLALGKDLGIGKMKDLSIENVRALMEELHELNVLRPTSNGRYLFTRYNFFQMMGTRDKLDEDLLTYMED